jgi:hypothetical protein
MAGILNKAWEALYSPKVQESKEPTAKVINSQMFREEPKNVTFAQLLNYHDRTPQIAMAVSSYKELITGTEMTITSDDPVATELIEDWNNNANFYEKFESLVSTILICGNGILEKLDEKRIDDVEEVDMSTIISKKRSDAGDETLWYDHRDHKSQMKHLGEGNMEKFIEFNLTNYGKQPWGKSLFYSLAVPRRVGNRWTPPLVEIMWGMEDSMSAMLLNNAYPITVIEYNALNDDKLKTEARRWMNYKPGDKLIMKTKPNIEFFETNPSSKYTDYVTHIEKVVEIGTQFPHDIMTGDFTSRASSDTTETIVTKKVRGFQRYLCNVLKTQLYEPILVDNNFDIKDVNLEIAFTSQNVIALEPADVINMAEKKKISIMECREWLRANTGMDLPDDRLIRHQEEVDRQQQQSKGGFNGNA